MKRLILGVSMIALAAITACNNDKPSNLYSDTEIAEQSSNVVDPANAAKLTFQETSYDFGDLPAGAKVDHYFKFTNTGKSPLIIKDAKGSCGCTVPLFPKSPIAPGASDSIKVSFDAGSFQGKQNKTVTLTTNTIAGKEELKISANIPVGNQQPTQPANVLQPTN